jgi:hypothetical protein
MTNILVVIMRDLMRGHLALKMRSTLRTKIDSSSNKLDVIHLNLELTIYTFIDIINIEIKKGVKTNESDWNYSES